MEQPTTADKADPLIERRWSALVIPSLFGLRRAGYSRAAFFQDVFGGLTAAVVALPLALAFGVASGAGAAAGLYGAIAVGLFASLFGGTPAQVSGPTGPMTVVMGAVVASHADSMPEAFTIVMLGGILQVLFGCLRVGRYVEYTPYSVISGFMTGIGVIILMIQTLPFLGLPGATGGGALAALAQLRFADISVPTAIFAACCLLTVTLWPRRLRLLPAPLAVLVVGTLVAVWVLPELPTIGRVPSGLPTLVMPSLSPAVLPQMLEPAFILALLGSIDTLLTSLVADSISRTQHDADKELIGQGIGNVAAGLVGGLPGAGATMRTVVNVRAGGRTAVSGILHALVLLALALGLGPLVARVPHALLAAILMKVGWDIIDWGYLRRLPRLPREKAAVMLVTLALTVFVDLITAVAVGIILASLVNARWLAQEQMKGVSQSARADELDQLSDDERTLLRSVDGRVLVTLLQGSFSYASAREMSRRAVPLSDVQFAAVFDFGHANYIDPSAALAIDQMMATARSTQRQVFVAGLRGQALTTLDALGVLDAVSVAHRFERRHDAIVAAVAACTG